MTGIESILIDTDDSTSTDQEIVLDEAADITGVDTIRTVGAGTQTTNLLIGNNFTVKTTADNANGETTSASDALVVDSSTHTGQKTIVIESQDNDQDVDLVNLDVRAAAKGGANIQFVNTGDTDAIVQLTVTTADEVDGLVLDDNEGGAADNSVNLDVTAGQLDKLIITDGALSNNGAAAAADGTDEEAAATTITIADAWTDTCV